MGLIPAGEPGKILQWYDAGGGVMALRNVTISDVIDQITSNVPIPGQRYYFDASTAGVGAVAQPLIGTGSMGSVALSGGAAFSASPLVGTGSLGSVVVTGGTPSSFGAPAVQGTGSLGAVAATGGAIMGASALAGTGTLAGVTVTGSAASHTTPTVAGTGTVATTTGGSLTTPLPAGVAANDILIAVVSTVGSTTGFGGFTEKSSSGDPLHVLWKRAGASETNPSFTFSANGAAGFIMALRGCVTSGDPFDAATANPYPPVSAASYAIPGVTTITDHTLLIAVARFADPGFDDGEGGTYPSSAAFSATTTGAATTAAARGKVVLGGTTYGVGAWTGEKATPGATGTTTVTISSPGDPPQIIHGAHFALKPQ